MSHSVSCSILRRSTLLESPSLQAMLAGFLRARRQGKDGVQINVHLKCNLDREDCTSLRFPFILPYAWISGRDSCLVGVSCHSPSLGLACLCISLHASCLNFYETLKWGLINPSSKWNSTRVQINSFSLNPKCPSKMFIIFALVQNPWQKWCTFYQDNRGSLN